MLDPADFYRQIREGGIEFFTGVPDSLLKQVCAYITANSDSRQHIIAANEGSAAALAIGHHLATGKVPLVYLQNSGLGNLINPLMSLADAEVFSVPLLLMIGWRGEPGFPDEPQHKKQGRVMHATLAAMEIPWVDIGPDTERPLERVRQIIERIKQAGSPGALVVKKGTFSSSSPLPPPDYGLTLSREAALSVILDYLVADARIVSTTGFCSRELFELRERRNQGHGMDFLTIGGMGHCSQIALGVALADPNRMVYCLDGDGSVLMHMGSLAIVGNSGCTNLRHIVFNNGVHDSVGAQPTVGLSIDLCRAARSLGYTETASVDNEADLRDTLARLGDKRQLTLLEVKVAAGARSDLGRPSLTPLELKEAFMYDMSK